MIEFPTQLVVPIGAVFAAAITATVSFIGLVVAKEQKISDFRQSWIDALRREISEFASNARRISAEEHPIDLRFTGSLVDSIEARNEAILRPDLFHENRLRLAQSYYAIRLRLNPEEDDHITLLQRMDEIYAALESYEEVTEALDRLSVHSQGVLKREWQRVKEGEPRYRRVAMVAKVVVACFAIILSALVLYSVISVI